MYLVMHLCYILLPGTDEKYFWQGFFAIQVNTIYDIIRFWCHILTGSLTVEERLFCSCSYWMRLSICISWWQIKAFRVVKGPKLLSLFWQCPEFISTRCCKPLAAYFQTTLSGKIQTTVQLYDRFFTRKEGSLVVVVFAFRAMVWAKLRGLLVPRVTHDVLSKQEKRDHHSCLTLTSPPFSPGDYLLLFFTSFCSSNKEMM